MKIFDLKRITIKDLSKMLSLAPSTISRALQDHPDIKQSTKDRVNEAVKKFNYIPNLHARYFRKKHSGLIALILPKIHMFFTPSLMEGINVCLDENEYSLIIFQSDNDFNREKELLQYCLSWMVDGLLIVLSDHTKDLNHLQILNDSNIPAVLLDKILEGPEFSSVSINDENASAIAVNHLVKKGCTNILGVFANDEINFSKQRINGFLKALNYNNIMGHVLSNKNVETLNIQLKSLSKNFSYDAVYTMSDELLIYSYNSLKAMMLPRFDDLSFISISDGKAPNLIFPKVDYIQHSGFEVGRAAAKLLINKIKDDSFIIRHEKVETFLIIND
jgi:LacI family transcriptional regulator